MDPRIELEKLQRRLDDLMSQRKSLANKMADNKEQQTETINKIRDWRKRHPGKDGD